MRFKYLKIVDSEQGTALVETAMIVPLLMLVLAGAVDFGRAYYLANEIAGAAEAGAAYGAQNITDTTGMVNAATYNAPDVKGLNTPTASWGCECSDGTKSSASCTTPPTGCSYNVVYYAKVNASVTYSPWLPFSWAFKSGQASIPSTITISKTVEMRSTSE